MPKWVYDPKSNSMVPQERTNDIEFHMLGMGFEICDYKNNLRFVVTPKDEIVFRDRGIHQYLYTDYRRAAQVAQRIHRVYPNSKYGTVDGLLAWRGNNESMSADDKAMFRCLLEEVDNKDIEKYVESLNESGHWFGFGGAQSAGKTPGTTEKGIKGALNALPSAVISFLVCPPAAILALLGAVRARAEARWIKSRINPNRWLDFIATPKGVKEKVRDQVRKEMAKKTQYYYTRLANGEILRVVGASTLEAKEMVMALEHKDIIPRYENWNKKLSLTNSDSDDTVSISASDTSNYIMWVIKFDNGEACYAFGKPDASDKEDIMEKAIESRKTMIKYFKNIHYKDEESGERKSQHHSGIGTDDDEFLKLFTVPKIDDMIKISNPGSYKIIAKENYKEFSTPQTGKMEWSPNGNVVYRINFNNIGTITLPLRKAQEVDNVLEKLVAVESPFAKKIQKICLTEINNGANLEYCKITNSNKDFFIIPCLSQSNNQSNNKENISASDVKSTFTGLIEDIASVINDDSLDISKGTREDCKKICNANRADRNITIYENGSQGDPIQTYVSDWSKHITYQKIDSKSGEILSPISTYMGGVDDETIKARANTTNPNVQNQQNQNQQNQTQQSTAA